MESAHEKPACTLVSHQLANAVFHLLGGLVGKGQCQNVPGLQALLQQISNFISKNAGLSRACSGNDQLRTVGVFHSGPLTFVQVVE